MEAYERTFDNANAMLAPTWHVLKMNDTRVELPGGLKPAFTARVSDACTIEDAPVAFESALATTQEAWEQGHPAPTEAELAQRAEYLEAEADATYGGTAMSAYQKRADAIEESRSLAQAFEHGMGSEAMSFVREAAGKRIVVQAAPGAVCDAQVAVPAAWGTLAAAAIDIVAGPNSAINLSLVVDEQDGLPREGADGTAGVAATSVRVFAGARSRVSIARTQTLPDGFTDVDDMALFADEQAEIRVRQTVLGASQAYAGLAGDLRGDGSAVVVNTAYLGSGTQVRDFNYSLRHHGQASRSELNADGVLAGKSSKTLRGTIDFVRGCRGSEGSEHENVLIIDEGVRNKTVPVLLCNEDDVAGNHGATIGHLRDDQLFYFESRGLSRDEAEQLFASAMVEKAALEAPDKTALASIVRIGEHINPGFSGLFEEGIR